MTVYKWLGLGAMLLLLGAGCSSLPGLRVLSGQETPVSENRVASNVDLVMADKSGNIDPSVLVAADRIEAALQNVDIVEIRPNIASDTFTVFLMFQPTGDPNGAVQDRIEFYTAIQLMVETTWLGTRRENERFDRLRIEWLTLGNIATLDKGLSTIAATQVIIDIARVDAMDYLSRQHDLQAFIALIVNGKMQFGAPPQTQFYDGVPNHPLFMIPPQQRP